MRSKLLLSIADIEGQQQAAQEEHAMHLCPLLPQGPNVGNTTGEYS
jgi:hypothetical protein